MQSVSESVTVNAPAEKVFKLLEEPERALTFIPGLTRITNVKAKRQVGDSWDYEFNWLGWVVSGRSECTGFTKPSKYQFKTVTGNPSTWTYRCEPAGGGTKLTLDVEYDVPKSQLARFASEGALKSMNQNTAKEIVANIKALVEG
jgi:carbon monoxide dehydrogenase subunit G